LKEYLKSHKPPTIIKMDVEGAEYNVISGGLDFLIKAIPLLLWRLYFQMHLGASGENYRKKQ